jgi:hypothetical protein
MDDLEHLVDIHADEFQSEDTDEERCGADNPALFLSLTPLLYLSKRPLIGIYKEFLALFGFKSYWKEEPTEALR